MGARGGQRGKRVRNTAKFEMMGRECNLDREESEDQRTYIHSFVHLKINILEHLLRGRTYSRT